MHLDQQNFEERLKKVEDYQTRTLDHDINLNQKIDRLDEKVNKLDEKVDNLKTEMNQRFDKVESDIKTIKSDIKISKDILERIAKGTLP